MNENMLDASYSENDPSEEIVLLTEEIIKVLPTPTALAARRCIILHWFDLPIVEALLEDQELSIDEMSYVYQQLSTLPFIDTLHFGLTFHYTTRQRLLRYYSNIEQQELLQAAARLAAPVYGAHEDDNKSLIEAFFCSIVAGDQEYGIYLQNMLFEQGKFHDWYYFEKLFQIQDEAEELPFVKQILPPTEQQLLLRGLLYRIDKQQDAALLAYNQALSLNPKSVIAYINRGITYAEQKRLDEALKDYNTALHIDRNAAQAYANRGVIYAQEAHHKEALKDFEKAIKIGLSNSFVLCSQGEVLCQLGRYEDALASYNTALRLDSEDIEASRGKVKALFGLKIYKDAEDASAQTKKLVPQYNIIKNANNLLHQQTINSTMMEKPEVTEGTLALSFFTQSNEAELVLRASRNDKDALIALYEHYVDRTYQYFYTKVGNIAEAEDLSSELFIRAVEALVHEQYVWQDKPFGTWLFGIAKYMLNERKRKLSGLPLIENVDALLEVSEPASQEMDLPDALVQKEKQTALWDLVRQLPSAEQQVLIMRYAYSLPYSEISMRLKRSEPACKQLHYRALAKLKRLAQNGLE